MIRIHTTLQPQYLTHLKNACECANLECAVEISYFRYRGISYVSRLSLQVDDATEQSLEEENLKYRLSKTHDPLEVFYRMCGKPCFYIAKDDPLYEECTYEEYNYHLMQDAMKQVLERKGAVT